MLMIRLRSFLGLMDSSFGEYQQPVEDGMVKVAIKSFPVKLTVRGERWWYLKSMYPNFLHVSEALFFRIAVCEGEMDVTTAIRQLDAYFEEQYAVYVNRRLDEANGDNTPACIYARLMSDRRPHLLIRPGRVVETPEGSYGEDHFDEYVKLPTAA